MIFALVAVVVGMGLKQKAEQEAQRQRKSGHKRASSSSLVAEDVGGGLVAAVTSVECRDLAQDG